MRNKLKQLKIRALTVLSEWFNAFPFFIQGRMDVDRRSLWFDPSFNLKYGDPDKALGESPITARLPLHDNVRRDMLLLLSKSVRDRDIKGAIAELGVYQGKTAKLLNQCFPERKLFLFDTFEGFADQDVRTEAEQTGVETTTAHFSTTALDRVRQYLGANNHHIRLIQGYFPESVTTEAEQTTFAFVHLDADLYAPTLAGLEFFYPRLNPGGFIVVHDYNAWHGARKAVDEYCENLEVYPIPMPDKSGSCLILKPML